MFIRSIYRPMYTRYILENKDVAYFALRNL